MRIKPWITSWFLASPPKGYVIEEVVKILSDPMQHIRINGAKYKNEYFWWHRIVAEIARINPTTAGRRISRYPDDETLQCKKAWLQAPMMKRCANTRMYSIMASTIRCCREQQEHLQDSWLFQRFGNLPQTETWKDLCSNWNCFNQTDNYVHRLKDVTSAWGQLPDHSNLFDPSWDNLDLLPE